MRFFSYLITAMALSSSLSYCNVPDKVYDLHGECYPKSYQKYDTCYPDFGDLTNYENSYEFLQMRLTKARNYLKKEYYCDAMMHFNYICFALIPKDKDILEEAKSMHKKRLYLFCDALEGRLACAYGLGVAGDPRHRTERDILNKIDDRIPKYDSDKKCYTLDYDFDEQEIQEFVEGLKDLDLIEKSTDVERLPNGGVQFRVKEKKSCCDDCKDNKKCEGEKKSRN